MKRALTATAVTLVFAFMSLATSAWAIDDTMGSVQCYSLKKETILENPPLVTLEDQFGIKEDVQVNKKADMYCTAVDINGIPTPDSGFALTCYKIDRKKIKEDVAVKNRFDDDEEGQSFETKQSKLVCVPTEPIL